jgi:5'-3' exonuclease/transcription antitermination factor NusG
MTLDGSRWVILELSPRADGEDPEVIRRSIAGALRGGAEVYIPAEITQVGANRIVHHYVEGYAFVRQVREDSVYFRIEGTRYVQSVLVDRARGRRCIATLSSAEIEVMQGRIKVEADQGIQIGDRVTIASGPYKDLVGIVLEDCPESDTVQVLIRLRSKEAIVSLPRSFLVLLERTQVKRFLQDVHRLRGWIRLNRLLRGWGPEVLFPLAERHAIWQGIHEQRQKLRTRLLAVSVLDWSFSLDALNERLRKWSDLYGRSIKLIQLQQMCLPLTTPIKSPPELLALHKRVLMLRSWGSRTRQLLPLLRVDPVLDLERLRQLSDGYLQVSRRRSRLAGIINDFNLLQEKYQNLEEHAVDNILVDGFNLAFRCRFAPGLSELADKQGRPTGMITGFIRSLASYRKRWAKSNIVVCWDGSSARRREIYSGYKANRPERQVDSFDQVDFLRGLLPLVGVTQAVCPTEEADDVIATLVSTTLEEERNLILSNDHDLLQLVTLTTVLLIPAVGVRKEQLYDADAVQAEYGVSPLQFVHYRAFAGDSSDNIPGVPRVPTKVLAALVRSHGTVDGTYASGLPGLTKKQYQQMRDSEAQVRLNVGLMTLRRDVPVTLTSVKSDQIQAESLLATVNVNPEIVAAFFTTPRGHLKES